MESPAPQSASEVLVIERIFKASPERVFDAFASGEAMKQWFGPGACSVLRADLDFRVGGRYRLRMTTETKGEIELVGEYRLIDRPHRLAYTWRWQDNPEFNPCDSVVEISFSQHPEGTVLSLRQTGIENEEDRANHNYGWDGAFDKLENLFT